MTHQEIGSLAKHAVMLTLAINDKKHGEKWRTNSDAEDIRHIVAHLGMYNVGDTSEPHIEHALTRISFILARLEIDRANSPVTKRTKGKSVGIAGGRKNIQ